MKSKITPKRQALIDAMHDVLEHGWVRVEGRPGLSVRWDRRVPFPCHQADGNGQIGGWSPLPEDDGQYQQSVFVSLVSAASNPLMRVNRAPWFSSQDSDLTLTRAFEVLADPASALDR